MESAISVDLVIENISKSLAGDVVVDKLNLVVPGGSFLALLGPSGCGKTTLLRMIAGLEQADQGRIMLGQEEIGSLPPYARPVQIMFQSYALFNHMRVYDNIAYGLRRLKLPREEIERRVKRLLHLLDLTKLAHRKPDRLSGGQRQRVALARALAPEPKILLLDEPLAALDKKLREQTRRELVELQKKLGTTFIMVTHDQEEALSIADHLAVMSAGKIVQMGHPAQIYEQPVNHFVADFVGAVNMVDAIFLEQQEAGCVFDLPDWQCRVFYPNLNPVNGPQDFDQAEGKLCMMLRPENLEPCLESEVTDTSFSSGPDTELHRVEVIYRGATYFGAYWLFHAQSLGGQPISFQARHPLPDYIQIGDRMILGWSPKAARFVPYEDIQDNCLLKA